jgi:hypothetical protein
MNKRSGHASITVGHLLVFPAPAARLRLTGGLDTATAYAGQLARAGWIL